CEPGTRVSAGAHDRRVRHPARRGRAHRSRARLDLDRGEYRRGRLALGRRGRGCRDSVGARGRAARAAGRGSARDPREGQPPARLGARLDRRGAAAASGCRGRGSRMAERRPRLRRRRDLRGLEARGAGPAHLAERGAVVSAGSVSAGSLLVGLDIGGTKVHAVAVDANGAIVHELRLPTGLGADAVLGTAITAVCELARLAGVTPEEFRSIGVGIPGSVDAEAGRVAHAVNLALEGLDLGPLLAERFGVPVRVENDVNAAALGAWSLLDTAGEAVGARSMAYLNLGTGLAAGVVIDGALWRGSRGTAGEVGH